MYATYATASGAAEVMFHCSIKADERVERHVDRYPRKEDARSGDVGIHQRSLDVVRHYSMICGEADASLAGDSLLVVV